MYGNSGERAAAAADMARELARGTQRGQRCARYTQAASTQEPASPIIAKRRGAARASSKELLPKCKTRRAVPGNPWRNPARPPKLPSHPYVTVNSQRHVRPSTVQSTHRRLPAASVGVSPSSIPRRRTIPCRSFAISYHDAAKTYHHSAFPRSYRTSLRAYPLGLLAAAQ